MLSSRLFWRIFLTHVLLIVVSTVALSMTVSRGYRELIESQFATETENVAQSLAEYSREVLSRERTPHRGDAFYKLADTRGYRVHVFDDEGNVVASTAASSEFDNLRLNGKLTSNLESSTAQQMDSSNSEDEMVLVRRIGAPSEVLGYLQLEAPRTSIERQLARLSGMTGQVTLAVCFFGVLLAGILAARITQPLEELTRASQAITIGNLYQTVPVNSSDELGTLAKTFNTMSRELSTRINELQQQGQQLRENSERLATVLGGMVEGVIAVDSKEQILFANDAAFRMIEFEARRVIGRPYWEVVRNTDVQRVVRDVLAGEYQLQREINLARSQSRIAFIASRLPGEPCPGVVLVLHDVTELRRLEKIRSEFVSNVGHELKTPVAAIQACTETLFAGAIDDPEDAGHFLQQITDHAERLHKLIIDLMELAKIESEEDAFRRESIDIGVPIQEAIDEHYSVAQSKHIELTYKSTIEELPVLADLDGVRTIVNNLLDNALNYTPEGGQVRVEWSQQGDDVLILISDTGMGIERKHLERIFERFYRVDSARSRDAGGTGLGLAIVKHLCQLFSGSIDVTSEPNQGSTFSIRFPLHRPTSVKSAEAIPS
ncbi:HAMP domain-containing sensor histidine kinase [Rubinisphaera brasiliensis]|uniref:histidine kinase n=1 Tax=Rubinisphaera brasiliensis (strain ATCC 49424 / DSM 5305 / JCM 21570 / IAM 15109 / NBRC 103401 / IFAM 1448) TaxID=756272 RepID=F0SQ61_RUBBR|nr:ATP-binding protein [Rubinisphaera brasiliensis]ADY61238.1 multi-sensor signal transduction histidine kinase [Rubinisphaera brasiliensis DSM 5305]